VTPACQGANVNQATNKNGPEILDFRPVL